MNHTQRNTELILQAINNLEYLVEVTKDPHERAGYEAWLQAQKRKLNQLLANGAGAGGS